MTKFLGSSLRSLLSSSVLTLGIAASLMGGTSSEVLAGEDVQQQEISQQVNQQVQGYTRIQLNQYFDLSAHQGAQVVGVQVTTQSQAQQAVQNQAQVIVNGTQAGQEVQVGASQQAGSPSQAQLPMPEGQNTIGQGLESIEIAASGDYEITDATLLLRDPSFAPAQPPFSPFGEILSIVSGASFYPGAGGVYHYVLNIYDRGYRSFRISTNRPRVRFSGRVFVQCNRGSGRFVYLQPTGAFQPAASFVNPCGRGGANRLDFYLNGFTINTAPRASYAIVGVR